MGQRARGRGQQPRAQARKARQLGLPPELPKTIMDAANELSHELFRLGIGVLIQEEDRARRKVASLERERAAVGWFARPRFGAPLREAREEYALWTGRLQRVMDTVVSRLDAAAAEEYADRRMDTRGQN